VNIKLSNWFFIALISLSVSFPAFSGEASAPAPCGMEYSDGADGDGTGLMKVKSGDTTICPEDIAFQGVYMLFAEVFQSPSVREIALLFIDEETLDSEFTNFADTTLSVSGPIYFLLSAMAIFAWAVGGPLVIYKGWQYFNMVQKTGNLAFAESRGDVALFVGYASFLFILLLPLGFSGGKNGDQVPITIGQGLSVLGTLPAGMGGNYMFSTYLAATDTSDREIQVDDDILFASGQSIANKLVQGQMCQINTQTAIATRNANSKSNFFSTSLLAGEVFDYDQNNFHDRFNKCLAFAGETEKSYTEESIEQFYLTKFSGQGDADFFPECNINSGWSFTYDSDTFGSPVRCLSVNYDIGQYSFANREETIEDSERTWYDSLEVTFQFLQTTQEELADRYSAPPYYYQYVRRNQSRIREIIEDTSLSEEESFKLLSEHFKDPSSYSHIISMMSADSAMKSGSNEQKMLRHQIVAGFLLGSSVVKDSFTDNFFKAGPGNPFASTYVYQGAKFDDENTFGIDVLLRDAWEAAELLRGHHCAVNWETNSAAREFVLAYNTADEDEFESLFSSKDKQFQCVKFLHEDDFGSPSDPYHAYAKYALYSVDGASVDDVFIDFKETDAGWVRDESKTEELAEIARVMKEEIAPLLLEDARVKQMLLAGYSVGVRKAVAESLRASLSLEESEAVNDLEMRPKGWAMIGGALLYAGQKQNNQLRMSKSLENVMTLSSGGDPNFFVESSVFDDDVTIGDLLQPYESEQYFSMGPGAMATFRPVKRIDGEDDSALAKYFFEILEATLLQPMTHIKAASGMDQGETLAVGLRRCFDLGSDACLSGTKHPVVALSNFGHDMIDNMLSLIILTKTLDIAMKAGSSDGGSGDIDDDCADGGKKCKKNALDKVKGFFADTVDTLKSGIRLLGGALVSIVIGVLMLASFVLNMLLPLFTLLMVVGAVFAFIIPMMAYLFSFMITILYIAGVFVTAFAMPLYAVIKLFTMEKDYQNGFKIFYQDMVGTYFTPIFFSISAVVAWSMIVVIMYAINVSFAVLHQGLAGYSDGGFIMSIVMNLFLYFIYFAAIFMLFRFGLGLMKSMPDMLKEKLSMKKGDDDHYISSLGFEQYVQSQMIKTFANMPENMSSQVKLVMGGKNGQSYKQLQDSLDRADEVANKLNITGKDAQAAHEAGARAAASNSQRGKANDEGRDSFESPFDGGNSEKGPASSSESIDKGEQKPSNEPSNLKDNYTPGDNPSRDDNGKEVPTFTKESDGVDAQGQGSEARGQTGKPTGDEKDSGSEARGQTGKPTGDEKDSGSEARGQTGKPTGDEQDSGSGNPDRGEPS
jgi:hypothetical protein